MRSLERAYGRVRRTRLVFLLYQSLPARLHDARNLSLESERAEAETADAELAKERPRTTAELAAVVLAGLELRLASVFDALCCSCHSLYSLSLLKLLLVMLPDGRACRRRGAERGRRCRPWQSSQW